MDFTELSFLKISPNFFFKNSWCCYCKAFVGIPEDDHTSLLQMLSKGQTVEKFLLWNEIEIDEVHCFRNPTFKSKVIIHNSVEKGSKTESGRNLQVYTLEISQVFIGKVLKHRWLVLSRENRHKAGSWPIKPTGLADLKQVSQWNVHTKYFL